MRPALFLLIHVVVQAVSQGQYNREFQRKETAMAIVVWPMIMVTVALIPVVLGLREYYRER